MTMQPNFRQTWLPTLAAWWDMRRRLLRLGSSNEREREAAIDWFVAQGSSTQPLLRRGLHGSVGIACSAAVALYRQGESQGVRAVLLRCYEEEWLLRCLQDGHLAELSALRRLGRGTVGAVLMAALDDAARETNGRACLEALIVSLSALRVLAVFDDVSPQSWWERAARFGPTSLCGMAPAHGRSPTHSTTSTGDEFGVVIAAHHAPGRALANSVTAWIRMEAINRLLHEHRSAGIEVLLDALQSEDQQVVLTAIHGLQKLRERRALPYLHTIAFGNGHALAAHARGAIERIAGSQADALILMRPAQEPEAPEVLLRAATATADNREYETLVRV